MTELRIEQFRAHIVEMMKWLRDFCAEHGLRIYLCGGTMLGAARHKGFIPWDDDADMMMPRPDYEQLLSLCETEVIPEHFCLVSFERGSYGRPFAKLLDMRTRVRSQQDFLDDGNAERIWLDILPVDGLPSDTAKLAAIYRKMSYWRKMLHLSHAKWGKGATKLRAVVKSAVSIYAKSVGGASWCKRMRDLALCCPYETAEYVGVVTNGLYGVNERMSKAGFEVPVTVSFEGERFEAPSCYESYLSSIYGDWKQLPPEEKRKQHRITAWLVNPQKEEA